MAQQAPRAGQQALPGRREHRTRLSASQAQILAQLATRIVMAAGLQQQEE